jgi:protein-tyrosine-phosphatase
MESKSPSPEGDGTNLPTTYNLLYVCTGNTCRSPLARAITERLIAARGWTHVSVDSAGTAGVEGARASENALVVAREHGLSLDEHRSKELTAELLEWADLVLVMTPSQFEMVARLGHAPKVALVTDFIEGVGSGQAVRDPFGGDIDAYRQTCEQLVLSAESLLERLEPILSP